MDFTLSTLLSPASGGCSGAAARASGDVSWTALFSLLFTSPISQRSRCRRVGLPSKEKLLQPYYAQYRMNDDRLSNRDSSEVSKNKLTEGHSCHDDDTISTVSATSIEEDEEEGSLPLLSCSFSSSSLSSASSIILACQPRNVTFANPLVTAVHYCPACSQDDKYYLYYSESDYIDFKLEYLTRGNSPLVRKTPRKVGFARDLVTSTHSVLGRQERKQFKLYYNEVELQRFLDDFVTSLQQHLSL
jgi:hypothetical protein